MEPDAGAETPPSSSVRCVDQAAASRVADCTRSQGFLSWKMQCVVCLGRFLFDSVFKNAGCWSLFDLLVSFFCWGFEVWRLFSQYLGLCL